MTRALLLALVLPLAACGSDEEPVMTIDGVDPVQTDGDLAPDQTLEPEASLEPEATTEPEPTLEPETTLQPDSVDVE